MLQGEAYQIIATVQKGGQVSEPLITKFQLRPLPPIDFRVSFICLFLVNHSNFQKKQSITEKNQNIRLF